MSGGATARSFFVVASGFPVAERDGTHFRGESAAFGMRRKTGRVLSVNFIPSVLFTAPLYVGRSHSRSGLFSFFFSF